MLATCVAAGRPTDGYLATDHPLQIALTASVAELVGPVAHAVKIADGAARAAGTVAIALAAMLDGVDTDALLDVAAATAAPVLGHGRPVGRVRSLVGAVRDTGA